LFTEWDAWLFWVIIWRSINCKWKWMIFLFISMMFLFFSHWSCSFSLRMNVLAVLLNEFNTLTFLLSFKSSIVIMTFISIFLISKSLLIRLKSLKRFWRYCIINIWDLFSSISHSAKVVERFKSLKRVNVNLIRRF